MNEIGRKITDKLIEISGKDKFSIAFLPYKRSMWNSMESVYEECKAAGAETYVIPLPYQRIVDGKVDAFDTDKDLFDNAQSVLLLARKKFDFVVIHYPYDDKNRVTRMWPEYHTDQLKKYGDVVYIPYSCTNMRQLRVQPGIANVDYAFVGTEAEADAFVQEWVELGVDFSGRVFGYGSPKMDAIQKLQHDEPTNTVLILNSLASYLYNPFAKIEQYKAVIIEQMAAGYTVIFRPHPLLRQTIKSMRPDTEHKYIELIEWAKSLGVYVDETEYLERALREADILISDPSSVLQMWQSTGREYKVL